MSKIAFILFTSFGFISIAFSQDRTNQKIDSLVSLLSLKGTNRVSVLLELAKENNIAGKYESAIEFADEAISLTKSSGDSLNLVMAYIFKGGSLRRQEKLDESLQLVMKAYDIAKRKNFITQMKFILNSMAVIYSNKAQYDRSLDCNFQSLVIRESEGDKLEISITLNNIGFVYLKLKNYNKAFEFFNRALKTRRESGDNYDMDRLLINVGLSEMHLGRYEDSRDHFREAFIACEGKCSNEVIVEGEFGLGVADYNSSDFREAKEHFNKSYSLAKETTNHRFQAENLIYIGKILMRSDDVVAAEKMFQEAEQIAKLDGYNQVLLDVYKESSALYSQTKNIEKENLYQRNYIQLKDSLISNDLVNNIAMIQAGYEQRENVKTIREQDEILRLKEEVISKVRAQYFFILTITILSILLTFVFIRFSRAQQRTNVELAKAKREIENKNQELELSNAELDARVKERTRELEESNKSLQKVNDELDNFIYKTSHDIRGPLASLRGMTNLAIMDVTDVIALDYFKKLDATAEKLNAILTRLVIVNHINHVTLIPEKVNCEEMIEDILLLERKKGVPSNMEISFEVERGIVLHTDKSVFRLALENLIDNAIKFHSDSDRVKPFVKIGIKSAPQDKVIATVVDNGIGIQESDQQKLFHMFVRASERSDTGGIGLYLAKLSAEKLGGEIYYSSTPERYTQFSIEIMSDLVKALNKQKLEEMKGMAMSSHGHAAQKSV